MSSPTFPARLQSARESTGMSLQGLADASGTSRDSVRLWLAGRVAPSIGNAAKLAEALGVTPCWLAYGCEKCSPVSGASLQDTAALSR
jgi:transcriptional regulator with XRE-family HTH domain